MGIPEFDKEIKLFKDIVGKIEGNMEKLSEHEKFVSKLNNKLSNDYKIYIEKTKKLEELLSTVATKINVIVSTVNDDLNKTFKSNSEKHEVALINSVKLVDEKYVNFKNDVTTSINAMNNLVDLVDKRLLTLNESKLELEEFVDVKQKQINTTQTIIDKKLSDFNLTLIRIDKHTLNSKRTLVVILLIILVISILNLVI